MVFRDGADPRAVGRPLRQSIALKWPKLGLAPDDAAPDGGDRLVPFKAYCEGDRRCPDSAAQERQAPGYLRQCTCVRHHAPLQFHPHLGRYLQSTCGPVPNPALDPPNASAAAGGADIRLNGSSDPNNPLAGILIFVDRRAPSSLSHTMNGGSPMSLTGAIYAPPLHIDWAGGNGSTAPVCIRLIADSSTFTGAPALTTSAVKRLA